MHYDDKEFNIKMFEAILKAKDMRDISGHRLMLMAKLSPSAYIRWGQERCNPTVQVLHEISKALQLSFLITPEGVEIIEE